ncbi:protein LHY-like isoform X5 [Hibiscus syriacus]|uniref:Protein LHY-like isoform X5 n=1 Tax=Hibiscus syriacus TaxID=106335 RepID=A0A6A3BZF4_HIBSY|nr:protein LHY-like isoform X5 [Hibiscus syriacus]
MSFLSYVSNTLEKEALAKGVPIGQALDIEIPPPRPKRKPSNPYPRKTGVGAGLGERTTSRDLGDEKATNLKENQDESCSEVFTLLRGANCSSASSMNKNFIPTSSCTFREFVPSLKETTHDNGTSKASNLENSCTLFEKSTQNYPRHVSVHVLDGSLKTCAQNPSLDMPFQDSVFHPMGNVHGPNLFANPAASATTEHQENASRSTHQALPPFHSPFMHLRPNQEDYRSFLHASSTFYCLIVSTLLQNPAAHAAASFAATFWPYEIMAAIATATVAATTVAASTAWWAANGLLPVCAPLHPGFTCAPASTAAVPPMANGQAPAAKTKQNDITDQAPAMQDGQPYPEYSEALQGQLSESKSPTSSSSDYEERGDEKVNTGEKATDDEKAAEVLEKHKEKEDSKGVDANYPQVERNRRSRSSSNLTDSWKEVSEEGRLAFQALFSREVLPQSFSPPHEGKHKEQKKEDEGTSTLDLNSKALGSCTSDHQEFGKTALSRGEKNTTEEGLLPIGLGHSKLKAGRTGFKPYKRCSVEAKENRVMNTGGEGEEKGPKRVRLEGEAST